MLSVASCYGSKTLSIMNRTKQAMVILLAGLLFIAVVIRAAGRVNSKYYGYMPEIEVGK